MCFALMTYTNACARGVTTNPTCNEMKKKINYKCLIRKQMLVSVTDFDAICQQKLLPIFRFSGKNGFFTAIAFGFAESATDDQCHVHTTCVATEMSIWFQILKMCGFQRRSLMWPTHTNLIRIFVPHPVPLCPWTTHFNDMKFSLRCANYLVRQRQSISAFFVGCQACARATPRIRNNATTIDQLKILCCASYDTSHSS